MNAAAERVNGHAFGTVERRLATVVPADQRRLDTAVTAALSGGRPGLVTLTSFSGSGQVMALVVPVLGQARDIFQAVLALVVFLEGGQGVSPDERSLALLRDAVGLTGRELDVVRLVVGGSTPREAAERLKISSGTARLHLKASFAKTGVHSQGELTALVRRLG